MSVRARLASFGVILMVTFAAAYAVGEAWPGDPAPAEQPDHPADHSGHDTPDDTGMTVTSPSATDTPGTGP